MSIVYCDRCSRPVDTDRDAEALIEPALDIGRYACLCEACRERVAIQNEPAP